ncbi:MAG: hypothetical protein AAF799_41170 [Myxococcota bacterium]
MELDSLLGQGSGALAASALPDALLPLLEQRGIAPDKAQLLAQLFAGSRDTATSEDTPSVESMRRRIARLESVNEMLRDTNDALAAALGACEVCWGTDDDCEACEGHGTPGSSLPDPRLFSIFALPALRRVRAARKPSVHRGHRRPVPPTKKDHQR